jgi:hypothetical protein
VGNFLRRLEYGEKFIALVISYLAKIAKSCVRAQQWGYRAHKSGFFGSAITLA